MSMPSGADRKKRPYEKPTLRTIKLVAEEVLAGGCKIPGASGFNSPTNNCINALGQNCVQLTGS